MSNGYYRLTMEFILTQTPYNVRTIIQSLDVHDENTIYKAIMNDDLKSFIMFTEETDFDPSIRFFATKLYPLKYRVSKGVFSTNLNTANRNKQVTYIYKVYLNIITIGFNHAFAAIDPGLKDTL